VTPQTEGVLNLEVPAGLVRAEYKMVGKKVQSVKITNIKSYLHTEGVGVECSGLGKLHLDVAYGGNFYGIIDPQENFKGMEHYSADQLIAWSREIRTKVNEQHTFVHPENPTINGMSHVQWTGKVIDPSSTARNAVFYGEKAIDRSPCGTGTSARMAQWYAQGKLKKGDEFIHESIIGSKFIGRIEEETTLDGHKAIIPSIEGWAMIHGFNHIILDDDDPYMQGFQVI
jgi:4-hydroxyproline epimerase